jgi:hypothetical protein
MKLVATLLLFLLLIFPGILSTSFAAVEIYQQKTLDLRRTPLDVAVSLNGKWFFVLSDQQEILIFSADGKLNDEIPVERHVDGIQVGGREDVIYLTSRSHKTMQVLMLDFIHDINLLGSPLKGREDAPVTVAVFSEFQ